MFKAKKDILKEKEEQIENTNSLQSKSVLFWGSQNSGKTSIVTILGKKLAEDKTKNILIIYTDENVPPLPYVINPKKIDNIDSLGNIYIASRLTKNYVIENITTLKDIKNLGFIGFNVGEYPAIYPNITETLLDEFFNTVNNIFDIVLIDGTTCFNTNSITFNAFEKADTIIQVCSEDIKSICYFKSQENFLNSLRIESTKKIVNKNKEYNNTLGKVDYFFPFCEEIENNFNNGDLLQNIKDKEFNKELSKLIKEIF